MAAKKTPKPLSAKRRKFVEAYAGNAADAARKAGYGKTPGSTRTQGQRLLTMPDVAAAIRARESQARRPDIATREERQAFWTAVMRGQTGQRFDEDGAPYLDVFAQMKASELLGKSNADFTEKVELGGQVTFAQLVRESFESSASPPAEVIAPARERGGSGGLSEPPEPARSPEGATPYTLPDEVP